MSLTFTFSYDAPVRANFSVLEPLSDGRMRDVNGNSYSREELTKGDVLSGTFQGTVIDSTVPGWSVQDIINELYEDAQDIVSAFLFSENDTVTMVAGAELTLPSDPDRMAYGEAGTDDNVWLVDRENVVVSITTELDPALVVAVEE